MPKLIAVFIPILAIITVTIAILLLNNAPAGRSPKRSSVLIGLVVVAVILIGAILLSLG